MSGTEGDLTKTAENIFQGLARSYERVLEVATFGQDGRWKRWLLTQAKPARGDLVLDLGCGTCLLEEQFGQGKVVAVGLDVSEPMLRMGQAKRLSCVTLLVQGDAGILPFRDSTFDRVVSCYVPKYTQIDNLASEVARVLKPGGSVAMYDFARPRGPYSLLLAFYIYGVIRLAGALLGAARKQSALTFQLLPGIVRRATWDGSVVPRFAMNGMPGSTSSLTGGAAVGFAATKQLGKFTDNSRPKEY